MGVPLYLLACLFLQTEHLWQLWFQRTFFHFICIFHWHSPNIRKHLYFHGASVLRKININSISCTLLNNPTVTVNQSFPAIKMVYRNTQSEMVVNHVPRYFNFIRSTSVSAEIGKHELIHRLFSNQQSLEILEECHSNFNWFHYIE